MPQYLSPGVYVEEVEAGSRPIEGVGTAVAAFVGITEKGPLNTPTLVSNWNQYVQTFGEFVEGTYLSHAVYGYFLNGGGNCYVVNVGGPASAPSAPSAPKALAAAPIALPSGRVDGAPTVGVTPVDPAATDLSIEVVTHEDNADLFNLAVKRGDETVEHFDGLSIKRGKQYATQVVNQQSKLVRIQELVATLERPAPGVVALPAAAAPSAVPATTTELHPDTLIGDVAARTGIGALEAIDEITMVAVPDLMTAYRNGWIDADGVKAVQLGVIAHCELMGDRMAIIDPLPSLNAQQVKDWRVNQAGYDSKYAALYWPWVQVFDPATGGNIYVPPSGHVAGLWGRTDDQRGVHKAPANDVLRGVVSLELNITKNEHDLLNPEGVNVIRSFPGRGVRVWGARTLSSDAAWKYVNVRRYFNYLEKSIQNGTQWCVFEPNDYNLWGRMRRTIAAFLANEWRKGALFGSDMGGAFFVKCDGENNVADTIDAGMVVCEIGVAPVKPAEFVIFRLSQYSGGASVAE